jgi:hypothetical protein
VTLGRGVSSKKRSRRAEDDSPKSGLVWDGVSLPLRDVESTSACRAAEQRFSRSGGNPVHVWEAILICTQPGAPPRPPPEWCNAYLHKVSQALLATVKQPGAASTAVSQALGLTRGGWSAGKAAASAARATRAALLYLKCRDEGMSAAAAYESVRKHNGHIEAESLRKLVQMGMRLLRHVPQYAQPVSPIKLSREEGHLLSALMRATAAAQRSVVDAAPVRRQRTPTRQFTRRAKPKG